MHKLEVLNIPTLMTSFKDEVARSCESRFLHRLHCVLLVAQGDSCYQVAKIFSEHPSTLERWVHCFNEHGIEGLKDEKKMGRPVKLHNHQFELLQRDISRTPSELGYEQHVWKGELLKYHLQYDYNIKLSVRQCQRLLKKLKKNKV